MGRTEYKQIYLEVICISEFRLKLVERYWGNRGQIKRNNFKQMWTRAQITHWKNMSVKYRSSYESLGMSSWYPFYIMVEHYNQATRLDMPNCAFSGSLCLVRITDKMRRAWKWAKAELGEHHKLCHIMNYISSISIFMHWNIPYVIIKVILEQTPFIQYQKAYDHK